MLMNLSRAKLFKKAASKFVFSEFMASISNDLFWKFFENVGVVDTSGSDKELYELCLTKAATLLSPSRMSLLKFSLAIHNDNPKLEMYYHLAQQHIYTLDQQEQAKVCNRTILLA